MKPAFKIATHFGAAAIGIALAATVLPAISSSAGAGADSAARQSAADAAATHGKSGKKHGGPRSEGRAAAFRAAWAALAKEPLSLPDRFMAQRQLLSEWSQVDLAGAIDAYLGEAWDGANGNFNLQSLGRAFSSAFQEQPLESWRVLGGDKMARQILASTWIDSVLAKEPGLVFSMLGELPARLHEMTISRLFGQWVSSPMPQDEQEALLAKLVSGGSPAQVETWMSIVARYQRQGGDPAELSAKWSAMPAGGQRIREMANWAGSLRTADPAKFTAEWEKVPAEDRGQAARLLLSQVNNQSPALLDVIGHAVEAGEWKALSAGVADKLRGFETDRQALAEWGLSLPPREEVRAIYNLSISESLLNDPVGGRQWLEQLPEGDWHREYGFVEMMLGSLWVRGDTAAAQRAIDAITDPRAREEAIKARYDWQLITSQKDMIRVD